MTSEAVRALNAAGLRRLRSYLEALRAGSSDPPPWTLLTDANTTEGVEGASITTQSKFANRHQLAKHLFEVLMGVDRSRLHSDVGLWSWLSLFHFDCVCPAREDGTRRPGTDYRHIFDPTFRRAHRHLLHGPFAVYERHGDRGILMLYSSVPTGNRFHQDLAARQALFASDAVIEAANTLYLNRRGTRPKRGAHQGRDAPGSLRRFIDLIQQLEVNFDLGRMTGDALLDLLPAEFNRWKPLRKRVRRRKTFARK